MKQRIYEVKYQVNLYCDSDQNTSETVTAKVVSQSIAGAVKCALLHAKENYHNLVAFIEANDEGEKFKYQWKDFDAISCNLLMETDA